MELPMKEKFAVRDPVVARLDEIVAELGRLYDEADQLIDGYVDNLSSEHAPRWPTLSRLN
jgi:hypothetical protein